MTDEEFNDGLAMVKYFWDEKGDIKRWSGWETFEPILKQKRPDVYEVISRYLKWSLMMDLTMRNL